MYSNTNDITTSYDIYFVYFLHLPSFHAQFYLCRAAGGPCFQLARALFDSGPPVRSEAVQAAHICRVTGAWHKDDSVGRDSWHDSGTIPPWLSGVVCVPALSCAPEMPRGDDRPRAYYTANGDTSPIVIFLTGIGSIIWRSGSDLEAG